MPSSRTKQLAKKLGLLKRGHELIDSRDSNKKRKVQLFSHVIVLDFESTCWKDRKGGQEIIEFPAVLVDVATCKILSEFRQYVQPQEKPFLSEFCTELTGIKQQQVDNGVPLPTCLMLFNKWLKKMEEDHGFGVLLPGQECSHDNWCALATWTDWDLEVCLRYECQRKGIKKPAMFNHWIDLKATYKTFYERKPLGVKGALLDLGLQFKGREHCGLDDAINTAHICIRLIEDGCQLKITKSINNQDAPPTKHTSSPRSCQLPVLKNPVDKGASSMTSSCSRNQLSNDSFNIPAEAWLDISIPDIEPPSFTKSTVAMVTTRQPLTESSNVIGGRLDKMTMNPQPVPHPPSFNEKTCNRLGTINSINFLTSPFAAIERGGARLTSTPIITSCHGNNTMSSMDSRNSGSSPVLFKTPSINCSKGLCTPSTMGSTGRVTPPSINGSRGLCTPSIMGSSRRVTPPSINGSKGLYTPGSFSLVGRVTPPLCKCGKRTKRKLVSTEGPNEGRPFYSCCMSRTRGCGFFEWESSIMMKYSHDFTPELLTSEYYD